MREIPVIKFELISGEGLNSNTGRWTKVNFDEGNVSSKISKRKTDPFEVLMRVQWGAVQEESSQ